MTDCAFLHGLRNMTSKALFICVAFVAAAPHRCCNTRGFRSLMLRSRHSGTLLHSRRSSYSLGVVFVPLSLLLLSLHQLL